MTLLEAHNLRRVLNDKAVLDGISLRVGPGEIVGLVGPNGTGKSTLVRAMLGQTRPESGRVLLDGRDIAGISARERARLVAYVPQRTPDGFPVSVFDACLLGRTPYMGMSLGARDIALVEEVLEKLNLSSLAFRSLDALSGGERQRVMLARALSQQTPLIVLDEPTSALDIGNQLFTLRFLADQVRERGVGILVAIHDLALAARFSNRIALLHRGQLIAEGPWQHALTQETIRATYGVDAEFGELNGAPVIAPFEMERQDGA
ncbi:ABC transporter ATP-binding protein [Nitratireductor aquimarinus]|uniref:ABC transporter ATP-binding protein n=1 Tax=Nitratireductor aquimarinus TaxID=889300 RepID=UPI0029356075|nr:ABC transporter ATP-binding protein [Nitratireductor aquimarinus]MDV2968546.1 ABC transporter ATP-binding protein [Nitratireductor aquimarinus]